ncbi:MAG: SLBB domain-containing protein [Spirochaetales bacterium]|nr:SLBB domain-containing protein [Spirochaetales bacterium]
MKKQLLLLLLLLSSGILFAQESDLPGFGQQPILTLPANESTLIMRILGSSSYKITPGDIYTLTAQMGNTLSFPVVVSDNFEIEVPFLGTMNVKGRIYNEVRREIISKIKAKVPVEFIDFIIKSPAVFDIFIYGGVVNPGLSPVSSVNTLWEAILLAKGPKAGASYRSIELHRNGETRVIDITRFVRYGELDQNPQLQPGDRIYVPMAQILTKIDGHVYFPDSFEMLPGESLYDLINLAGGPKPGAVGKKIQVTRLEATNELKLYELTMEQAMDFKLAMGDQVYVKSAFDLQAMLLIEGALMGQPPEQGKPQQIPTKPLVFNLPYVPGMTFLSVLEKLGGPSPLADAEHSYVIREKSGEKIPVNVTLLWQSRDKDLDIQLQADDHIFIPMLNTQVIIAGMVNNPDAFPYATGATVADYIMLAGGIIPETADPNAIYRLDKSGKRTRIGMNTEVIPGDLIYVDKTLWEHTKFGLSQALVIIGFVSTSISLVNAILDLSQR